MSLIYGSLLALAGLDALFLGYINNEFYLGLFVMFLGLLILLNSISTPYDSPTRKFSNSVRRWFFGALLILLGIEATLGGAGFISQIPLLGALTLDQWGGKLLLLIIGAIYFFSAFTKTRNINLASY